MVIYIRVVVGVLICALAFQASVAYAQDRRLPGSNTEMQLSFAPLVEQVAPAVVNITTRRVVARRMLSPFAGDPFFGRFFQDNFFGGQMRRQIENSLGSGVIVDSSGLIVTNAHVVEAAEEITVALADGREFEARLRLRDTASDLAILQIEEPDAELPSVELKPSESLRVGDLVLAIGNPFGVGQTVTSGIVSAQGRSSLDINDFNFFIQTDAAINPGNSGGPLVALDGGVVGINTAIFSRDGGSLGIGFAIPSEMVASVIAAARSGQDGQEGIVRPWLGLGAQNLTADLAETLDIDRPQGVLVAKLHTASPLKDAGLRRGDIIIALNEREVRDAAAFKFRMATIPLGARADVTYIRDGMRKTASILAMAPPNVPPRNEIVLEQATPFQGAKIATINPAVETELDLPVSDGVAVLEIAPRSPASRLLRRGDVIVSVNGEDVENSDRLDTVLNRLSKNANAWDIVINRQGRERRIVIR